MHIYYLDREFMEKMCHSLAVAVFDTHEDPISQFDDHELSLLDSALQSPRQTFNGKDLYPKIENKAAILYYTLNKNHPFHNGNKRIATASLLVFLYMNDYWLNVPKETLLEKTLSVAESDPKEREKKIIEIETWIAQNLIKAADDSFDAIFK